MKQIGWIFPGQGAQSAGMGKKYVGRAAFDAVIDVCENITGKSITNYLTSTNASDLMQTDRAQLAIFAMSMGISACLKEEGYSPDFVAGHSLGHLTALTVAGALSLEEGANLVAIRGQLMLASGKRRAGGMGVVQRLEAEMITKVLREEKLNVWPANLNLRDQTVVSGAANELAHAQKLITSAGGRWTLLNVSGAFHSPLLEEEAKAFACRINELEFRDPVCPVISNRDAQKMGTAEQVKRDLIGHMTSQVRWTDVMDHIADQMPNGLIEVGPGKILTGLMLRHNPMLKPQSTGMPVLLVRAVALLQSISQSSHVKKDAA